MLALDSETTGVDLSHGAAPLFVTTCDEEGNQQYFEWDVDPLTRKVLVPKQDVVAIKEILRGERGSVTEARSAFVGQNLKFDARALSVIGISDFPWDRVEDTLIASHVLASNQPHDLTALVLHYLGIDIEPHEETLEKCVKECRNYCRSHYPDWRIAKDGEPDMPSATKETWRFDYWLPRAVVKRWWQESEAYASWEKTKRVKKPSTGLNLSQLASLDGWEYRPPDVANGDHVYWTVLRDYANCDSGATIALWQVMEAELRKRDLWEIYREQMRLAPICHGMEAYGITYSTKRLERLRGQYREASQDANQLCLGIARSYGYDLSLPRGAAVNDSLRNFMFEVLKVPKFFNPKAKTATPTLNGEALEKMIHELPDRSKAKVFVEQILAKRDYDKKMSDLDRYERYSVEIPGDEEYRRIHTSLNQTGTDTLRMSSANPGLQNCSKQPDEAGLTLRYCFGPVEGKEWWCLDYVNIELMIPAYEAGEKAMIELFEKPNDPPYYGSYHLLNASILYPELFTEKVCPDCVSTKKTLKGGEKCSCSRLKVPLCDVKGGFKAKYDATWYKCTKFFGFGFQYGGGEATCDRQARRAGAYKAVCNTLSNLTALNKAQIAMAQKMGYVETIPDRTVNPRRGYPILCSRTEYGGIKPTVPLNYHTQSTAMQCTRKAMIRWQEQMKQWRRKDKFESRMILQVHDELIAEMPARSNHGNLEQVKVLQRLMMQSGDDIGIPLRVSISYNPCNWAEGESVT